MALPENPITRKETYLAKIAGQEVSIPNVPITREEAYLDEIAKNGGGGGYVLPTATADRLGGVKIGSGINVEEDGTISASGGGGTDDYNDLDNQPQINGVTLSSNKTTSDLGINANNVMMSDGVTSVEDALDNRVVGIHISSPVNGVSASTAWGALYSATVSVDISSLGLANVPTILSVVYNNSTSWAAYAMVSSITNSNVNIILFRPSTGTLTGTVELIIRSNG